MTQLTPQAAHEIYDNTKLSAKKKCPRLYYYRHVRHWRLEGMAAPLVFGLSWHAAMDVVWQHYGKVSVPELVQVAMHSFNETWTGEGAPLNENMSMEMAEKWNPRLPSVANEMLYPYIQKRTPILQSMQLVAAEAPFAVPLWPNQPNIWYAGRKDKRIIYNNMRLVIEHKSTTEYKKDGGFKSTYVEGFIMSSQVMGYSYSDNIETGGKTKQVWVDAALVHKQVHDAFRIIPVEHLPDQMDQWLFDTRREVEEIKRDTAILHDLRAAGKAESPKFMPVFGRNQESCIGPYGKCAYFNVCTQFPNPEQQYDPPPGMIEEEWNPFDILKLSQLDEQEAA